MRAIIAYAPGLLGVCWVILEGEMFSDRSTNRTLIVSAGIFFSIGMLAALGLTLPEFARNNGTSLGEAGAVFTALFLGSIPAQVVSGWLNDRFGPRPILVAGILAMAVGLLGATLSRSFPITLACMAFAGLGDGALILGANVMVAQGFTQRRTSALNLLNVFFGVGGIIGPLVAGASLGIWGAAMPALWFLAALLVLTLPAVLSLSVARESAREENAPPQGPLYRSSVIWLFSFLLLLYVGVEVGTGGWIPTYMERTTRMAAETAALVASGLYMAITAGRLIGAALGTRLSSERVLLVSMVGAVLGGLMMLLSVGSVWLTVAAVLLLGASFGPVYPTVLAIVTARFPVGSGKAASLVIASGSVGGTLLPWFQGMLIEGLGAPSLAQSVAGATVGMLAILGVFALIGRRHSQATVTQGVAHSVGVER